MLSETPSLLEEANIIATIRSGDDRAIEQIYLSYKSPFFTWASSKFSLSNADLTDCWQESIIAFYEQVSSGRLQKLDVGLKTYLFAIGRNKILYKLRSEKAVVKKEQIFAESYALEKEQSGGYLELDDIQEEQKEILRKAMQSLSEKNRSILIRRYYDGLSLEKIQESEGYSSINGVSSTLSRALGLLKKIVVDGKKMIILLSFCFGWQ
jgi:RNA polymerase sigma factor (sigma-70 family)